ncbi:hypothetical protein EON67_06730 [archaeon]|nr:MAG: hypothetical protein EON67_06730 [archaeon]
MLSSHARRSGAPATHCVCVCVCVRTHTHTHTHTAPRTAVTLSWHVQCTPVPCARLDARQSSNGKKVMSMALPVHEELAADRARRARRQEWRAVGGGVLARPDRQRVGGGSQRAHAVGRLSMVRRVAGVQRRYVPPPVRVRARACVYIPGGVACALRCAGCTCASILQTAV